MGNSEKKFMEQVVTQLEAMRLKHLAAMKELQAGLEANDYWPTTELMRRIMEINHDMTILTFMLKRMVNPYGD